MASASEPRIGYCPPKPHTIEELGIPESMVQDLMFKRLLLERTSTLTSLSRALRLSVRIVEEVFQKMRQRQFLEVLGMVGNDYTFMLSSAGRTLAQDRFEMSHYASAAPVTLKEYAAVTKAQMARVEVNRRTLRLALSDLVVTDEMLDTLGPAVISQAALFLYGSTGNGKTCLAERLVRIYQDVIVLPHSIEVDGQIIMIYDPVVHETVDIPDLDIDPRWIVCRRPCIITGGELVPSMLDLRLDESSGVYAAPLQMKANNGVLVIDDFGRQLMSPRDLLNRWIVPLDRRVDYLMLRYGVKFQIPFELMVVFATNLDPSSLADEAFLRRIQNKIYVDTVDPDTFDEILRRVTTAKQVPYSQESAEYLRKLCLSDGRTELRACYPNDVCSILQSISKYEGRPVQMSRADLERAVGLYFARA